VQVLRQACESLFPKRWIWHERIMDRVRANRADRQSSRIAGVADIFKARGQIELRPNVDFNRIEPIPPRVRKLVAQGIPGQARRLDCELHERSSADWPCGPRHLTDVAHIVPKGFTR
jgi:hypothetical protein